MPDKPILPTIDITTVDYPHIRHLLNLFPNADVLLGKRIYWTEKRDGSNLGIYLDDADNVRIRTRNEPEAHPKFYDHFNQCPESANIIQLLYALQNDGDNCVVFAEILRRGRSPAKFELNDDHHIVVFDIWSTKMHRFMPDELVRQYCQLVNVPVVELYGVSESSNLQDLWDTRDRMLAKAAETDREGVVGKVWCEPGELDHFKCYPRHCIYFKEKRPRPGKMNAQTGVVEPPKDTIPVLSPAEIYGEIDKVYQQLGLEEFRKIEVAMPIIGKQLAIECKAQNCRMPNHINTYYYDKLKTIIVDEENGGGLA